MVIEVNKDIDRYQESVAMGLTARQLIFSMARQQRKLPKIQPRR